MPSQTAYSFARSSIIEHEDLRMLVYDDATGKPVVPGYTMIGHPTIGYGRALDIDGISKQEAGYLLDNNLAARFDWLERLPWFTPLDDVRQAVIADLSYNVGLVGLLNFTKMIAAIRRQDYVTAGREIIDSKLSPRRARDLARVMTTGIAAEWMRSH